MQVVRVVVVAAQVAVGHGYPLAPAAVVRPRRVPKLATRCA